MHVTRILAFIRVFKIDSSDVRAVFKVCPESTVKTSEKRLLNYNTFIAEFEQIHHIVILLYCLHV